MKYNETFGVEKLEIGIFYNYKFPLIGVLNHSMICEIIDEMDWGSSFYFVDSKYSSAEYIFAIERHRDWYSIIRPSNASNHSSFSYSGYNYIEIINFMIKELEKLTEMHNRIICQYVRTVEKSQIVLKDLKTRPPNNS